ncbi:MAG TPA: hypothetical protein EYN66_10710 [Myxococcales bacterium]|nr:hypothetical protein [Myxococcales bacterium]
MWSLKLTESRFALPLIILAAFVVRIITLGSESYWFDEIWAVKQSQSPLAVLLDSLTREDVHPPLYPVLLWSWIRMVGTSEWSTRLLSVLFSTASVWAIFALGRVLYNRSVGLVAAALLAFQGFAVFYAQESRAYSLLLLTSLLSTYLLIHWSTRVQCKKSMALYIVAATALAYTHVYGLFLLLAHGVWVLGWVPELRKRMIVAGTLVLLCFSPWLPVFLSQVGRVEKSFWIEAPTLIDLPKWLYYWAGYNPVAGIIFALLAYLGIKHTNNLPQRRLMLLWTLMLVVLPVLISLFSTPIFHHKYAIAFLGVICILAARGFVSLPAARQTLSAGIIFFVLLTGVVWQLYLKDNKEQWRELAEIGRNAHARGDIVAADAFNRPYLPYYLSDTPIFWVKEEADLNALEGLARFRKVEFVYLQVHPPKSPLSDTMNQRFDSQKKQRLHRAQAVHYSVKSLQRHKR